jgi:hypothetical protein
VLVDGATPAAKIPGYSSLAVALYARRCGGSGAGRTGAMGFLRELPLWGILRTSPSAGCIDTGLPAGRRNFGQSDKPLIEIAHVHHAMWVTFTETR